MLKICVAVSSAFLITACVTTPEMRANELAYCQRMEREMGVNHIHDHTDAKGMGIDPMHVTHNRCRKILGMK